MINFSVLMSVYKFDDPIYVSLAIDSILNQSLMPNQVVIIVDGPISSNLSDTINTYESGHQIISCYYLDENRGLSYALNYGLEKCTYDYVARMDSDDISLPHRFERQICYLDNNKDIALLGSWYAQYDESMLTFQILRMVPELNADLIRYSKSRTPFNHVTAIFRKSKIIDSGGYPDIEGLFEDWWLAHNLISNGYRIHNLQEILVNVRGGKNFLNRRGGFKYLISEVSNLFNMYQAKHFTVFQLIKNLIIRIPIRLLPNKFRFYIYALIRIKN
jgi:glycosyltransferase involved in cell wall biosynthesis